MNQGHTSCSGGLALAVRSFAPPLRTADKPSSHSPRSHMSALVPRDPILENWPITGQPTTVADSGPQLDNTYICTHTHTRLTALSPGLPRWASTRKVKPIWILLKQETVSGSGISWAICKSARCSGQTTMPAPHHSVFYRPDALPADQPTASKHWRHTCMYTERAKLVSHRDSHGTCQHKGLTNLAGPHYGYDFSQLYVNSKE